MIVAYIEKKKRQSKVMSGPTAINCLTHGDQTYRYVCVSCSTLVCDICLNTTHHKHTIRSLRIAHSLTCQVKDQHHGHLEVEKDGADQQQQQQEQDSNKVSVDSNQYNYYRLFCETCTKLLCDNCIDYGDHEGHGFKSLPFITTNINVNVSMNNMNSVVQSGLDQQNQQFQQLQQQQLQQLQQLQQHQHQLEQQLQQQQLLQQQQQLIGRQQLEEVEPLKEDNIPSSAQRRQHNIINDAPFFQRLSGHLPMDVSAVGGGSSASSSNDDDIEYPLPPILPLAHRIAPKSFDNAFGVPESGLEKQFQECVNALKYFEGRRIKLQKVVRVAKKIMSKHIPAAAFLGCCYALGHLSSSGTSNFEKGIPYLKMATNVGHPRACYEYGRLLVLKLIPLTDTQNGVQVGIDLVRRAAVSGYYEAFDLLSQYHHKRGEIKVAIDWQRRYIDALELPNPKENQKLIQLYWQTSRPEYHPEIFKILREEYITNEGRSYSILQYASCYQKGIGTEINMPRAMDLYIQAGENRIPEGYIQAGIIHMLGYDNIPKDFGQSKICFDLAASLGYYNTSKQSMLRLEHTLLLSSSSNNQINK
ncbi:hypothetical protein DFA_07747 [Cavenderia fasciculata]|uniref:B box-type domain-containing protein n=1 Tax=Cavenderia fasciculata TaxID=261658 RepID=F4Q347_CACFS|nr:uncharacterized protein DFA_07747 [Cavenderia fasciculata]EGG16769.1 hypothetical protein DFA_07747 [Cavenderia fasciculata]|eukprot:XP_004355243.1 hypothetical protein DFA_07747 [Cavenderia fasciculata]